MRLDIFENEEGAERTDPVGRPPVLDWDGEKEKKLVWVAMKEGQKVSGSPKTNFVILDGRYFSNKLERLTMMPLLRYNSLPRHVVIVMWSGPTLQVAIGFALGGIIEAVSVLGGRGRGKNNRLQMEGVTWLDRPGIDMEEGWGWERDEVLQ